MKFECKTCGQCCRGDGYVWISLDNIEEIAQEKNMNINEFAKKYVRKVGNKYSLIDKPSGDCIFYDPKKGCEIYPVRPLQCQEFPYWDGIKKDSCLERMIRDCPGVSYE